MNNFLSELQFESYFVEEMVFKRNQLFVYDLEPPKLNVVLNAQVTILDDDRNALVTLECSMFDEQFNENTAPFYLTTKMVGVFSCSESLRVNKFRPNAVAILLPYLRAVISSFTVQTGIPPVILPPINVFHLLDEEEETVVGVIEGENNGPTLE